MLVIFLDFLHLNNIVIILIYQIQNCGPEFDPTLDPEFGYIFDETLRYSILNPIRKTTPFIDKSKFIFCMDCPRKNIWRRDFYPEYKLTRDLKDNSKDKFNISRMFKYAYEILLPNICEDFSATKVMCGCAEGDDVIAVLTKYFLDNTNEDIVIISCDKDMVQLYRDRVSIITVEGNTRDPKTELESKLKIKIDNDITAGDFLLFKILIGDSADNIPNIKSGIGPKKAWKYIEDRNLLKQLLKEDITIADSFKRNKRLIAMSEIPQEIHTLVLEEYQQQKAKYL
jgi:5'-3' exonuclease